MDGVLDQNIGGVELSKRRIFGAMAVVTAMGIVALRDVMPAMAWVLVLGFLAWSAALCFLQTRHRVCVVYAARGLRNLGDGVETVETMEERATHQGVAYRVHLMAGASWGAATALATLVAV